MITEKMIEAGLKAANDRYLDFMIEDKNYFDEAIKVGISAALAAQDQEPVRNEFGEPFIDQPVHVRKLEWRDGFRNPTFKTYQASGGTLYQVREHDGVVWLDVDNYQTIFPTVDAAKAAAQFKFEAHIRSATHPPVQGVETVPDDTTDVAGFVPRLDSGGTYLAKDNKGQWHYLNHAGTWQGYAGPLTQEPLQALLTDVLRVLDSYADPTSYLDSNGEYLPADAVLHDGLLAKDTAAKVRAALSKSSEGGE